MSSSSNPDRGAAQHLGRLAEELRKLGLTVGPAPDGHPFPGVEVTGQAGSVVILAGSAHYWRPADGDLKCLGPLNEHAAVARKIRDHLTGGKHEKRR